jgi:predicted LPLAT superfamily acyltransferase
MNAPVLTTTTKTRAYARPPRNPGPSWGYTFLRLADRVLPEWFYRPARAAGTWVAMLGMHTQRLHSRNYLRVVLGREPTTREVFRHFLLFQETLILKLRVANGRPQRGVLAGGSEDFQSMIKSEEPALLGTFHFAHSDLTGFLFGGQEKRRVALIRQRVENSRDTDQLAQRFAGWVSFIWVNAGENPLFAIKEAIASGSSVALTCDRIEFSARGEPFHFLGARRLFPFTIYHLALIFEKPVLLSVGVPWRPGETVVHSSPAWFPNPALSREQNFANAREHFQAFLVRMEDLLRINPYWWFNFIELNPEVSDAC